MNDTAPVPWLKSDLPAGKILVVDDVDEVRSLCAEIIQNIDITIKQLSSVEEDLYQVRNRSNQDPLNYPIKLGNKLASLNGLVATGDFKPTDQAYLVRDELTGKIDKCLERFNNIRVNVIPAINTSLREAGIDYIDN